MKKIQNNFYLFRRSDFVMARASDLFLDKTQVLRLFSSEDIRETETHSALFYFRPTGVSCILFFFKLINSFF